MAPIARNANISIHNVHALNAGTGVVVPGGGAACTDPQPLSHCTVLVRPTVRTWPAPKMRPMRCWRCSMAELQRSLPSRCR